MKCESLLCEGSWDGSSEWEILIDEVKQCVVELSVESGKHPSKRHKREQRGAFRDFLSTIIDRLHVK